MDLLEVGSCIKKVKWKFMGQVDENIDKKCLSVFLLFSVIYYKFINISAMLEITYGQ